jgi:hypoxanthine phosphoribosyltransferase
VATAVMVIKDRSRNPAIPLPDFDTGMRVPDVYVFGCGMDLYERWRHLPAIYGLRDGTVGHGEE